ncbi:uncharacterized protein LOC141613492 [Silene latifolia]|uniref:uncharacterized protein LOC141613492 n=1 Tax=Silene latifolia TaxID=37657 RepID=UPI003D77DDE8
MKASRFVLVDNVLFRKSLAGPYLRCLDREEAQTVLHAIHNGECGNHAGGRSLSNKALSQEAEAFTEVKDKQVISFIKRNILCRFEIPSEIICDNGSQFVLDNSDGFCARWNISLKTSAPRNPQSNGQAESITKIIVENLRKRLEELEENGQMNCPRYYGQIGQPQRRRHAKPPSAWCLEQRQ